MRWKVHDKSEREMVDYFLGGMTDEEQAEFEDRYFADDDLFEQLRIVKQELVDAYVRDQLDANDRERFERHFLNSPERREQVAFAQALRKTLNEEAVYVEEKPTAWREKWFDWWSPGAWALVAVTLLLAAGSGWLFLENRQLRRELDEAARRQADLQRDLANAKSPPPAISPTPAALSSPPPTPTSPQNDEPLVVLALNADTRRGSTDPSQIVHVKLPSAGTLLLRLNINFAPAARSCTASLFAAKGRLIASQARLSGRQGPQGYQLDWLVAAAKLKAGEYSVKLSGYDSEQKENAELKYRFRVVRR